MQPLQYDLRSPAAKDNSITNAATARSNLDAAITMRSAETELQNAIDLLLLSGILEFFWALFFFKVRGVAGAAKNENQK